MKIDKCFLFCKIYLVMVSLTFYYFFFKQFLCSVPSLLVYPCVNVTGSMDSIAVSFIRSPNVAVVELIVTDQIIYDMGLTGLLDRDCFVNNAIFFFILLCLEHLVILLLFCFNAGFIFYYQKLVL